MKTRVIATALFSVLWCSNSLSASLLPHQEQIARHPEALEIVEAREMKFLIDPAKIGGTPEPALNEIWDQVKQLAAKHNIALQEKAFAFDNLTFSSKVYFDTPNGDLTKLGYIARITTKYLEGKPASAALTIKFIDRNNPELVFGALEFEEDATVEENVGPALNAKLDTYLEKSIKYPLELDNLPKTVADFAFYLPDLEQLDLPPKTPMEGVGAYSIRMKPGYVLLPNLPFPAGISMEAWLPIEGGEQAFVYDFSFGYPTGDYYDMPQTHIAAEQFMQKLYAELNQPMGLANNAKWRGSKASYLRGSNLKHPKFTQLKQLDLRSYKEPAKSPDGTVAFNDDPS